MPELKPGISNRYLPEGSMPKPLGSANTFSSSCPFSYGTASGRVLGSRTMDPRMSCPPTLPTDRRADQATGRTSRGADQATGQSNR